MNKLTVLKMMQFGGVLFILAGIMLIAFYGTIEFVGPLYMILGAIMILFGLLWIIKVRKAVRRMKHKSAFTYAILYFLLLSIGFMGTTMGHLQAFSKECYTMYQRVIYVEYIMIGLLIISGFLAFAPIILGRTILGPILQELQYMAGAMLLLLIFALLVVFPLDPMFVLDNPQNPTACYVDIRRLQAQGPPILQILLRLFTPPAPTFT